MGKCQYCDRVERERKALQSELNDAYTMLDNRDKRIVEMEEERREQTEHRSVDVK